MHYDPVKNVFAAVIRFHPFIRVAFFKLLDLMFLRSWYVRRELRKIRARFPGKTLRILDAGCGYGQYTWFMFRNLQPCIITSVDVKEDWINDLKSFLSKTRISGVSFAVEDLTAIQYDNEYDLIICIDVMEHIPDDQTVFDNFARALSAGGSALINSPSIYGGSDVHEDHEESFIGEHARVGYSNEELEEKLSKSGFTNFHHRYTYGFWGDKAWRLGIKIPMLIVNVSKIFLLLLPVYFLFTLPFTFIMMMIDYLTVNEKGSGINFTAEK
jgi:SAM-dependent methyltransferase